MKTRSFARGACTPKASAATWPRRSARIARPVRESSRFMVSSAQSKTANQDAKEVVPGVNQRKGADRQRRDAGDAVVAAEEFELAEQIEQPEAPGDGAERQIMGGQPHRDEAEQDRGDAADQKRKRQRQPWRQAGGRGQHRRGIGAEAAKRRLAE